jgi:hypothetical protein
VVFWGFYFNPQAVTPSRLFRCPGNAHKHGLARYKGGFNVQLQSLNADSSVKTAKSSMRFNLSISLSAFVLATITTTAAACAAVCPTTLLPGPAEVAWSLVFNRDVADNVMFCGYAFAFVSSIYSAHI